MNPGYLSALVNAFIYWDGMPIVIIKKKNNMQDWSEKEVFWTG